MTATNQQGEIMGSSLQHLFDNVRVGEPMTYGNLQLFPLFPKGLLGVSCSLLSEAISTGAVEVSEALDAPGPWFRSLVVLNRSARPVLLREADLLVGGKQDRVADRTVMVPPNSRTVVPVSCVEATRSSYGASNNFDTAASAANTSFRTERIRQVAMTNDRPNQSQTWTMVDEHRRRAGVTSQNSSMRDVAEKAATNSELLRHLPLIPGACGLVAVSGSKRCCEARLVEVFGALELAASAWTSSVRGLECAKGEAPGLDAMDICKLFDVLGGADERPCESLGLGTLSHVIDHSETLGTVLVHDDKVVHTALFPGLRDSTAGWTKLDTPQSETGEPPMPIVAVADLHGHLDLFDRLVRHFDVLYARNYKLVLLGDYVDNGPQMRPLIDRLIQLQASRGDRFVAIMGNHDLAALRAMGWDGGPPDEGWYRQWRTNYCNSAADCFAAAYGARSGAELAANIPADHRRFLQELPWFAVLGDHLFVHAGMELGPLSPQLAELELRLPMPSGQTQHAIRDKRLSTLHDPNWNYVVVSAHTSASKLARHYAGPDPNPNAPHFIAERRICLAATVDHRSDGGGIWAVSLPSRELTFISPQGEVRELAAVE
ncbi:MAG: hypothetical protein CO108_12190 [Deltaproteobacteria bacterium CG_4_9_14_3_um_filter_63_12]|nr:MAG: hypothetical protein CO108_12190 [Deltaproteobacteria bacterium CG_4_9_14_3_um_filter_63_12]